MRDRLTFSVTEQEQGKQADWIMKNCLGMSRREISRAKFTENGICVNGQRSRVTARLREGDLLEILLETEREACSAAGKQEQKESVIEWMPPLDILYEDRDVLVINKQAGTLTHPVGCHGDGTASDQVQQYLQRTGGNPVARSVGRLDKETSGLLLFARNRMAAARLQEQRKQGKLRKIYLAVVEGVLEPPAGVIHLPLGKAPSGREAARIVVNSSGQDAITEYRVLGRIVRKETISFRGAQKDDAASLVACMLQTGRTHQIRVHMAHLGYPLAGDCIYGRGSGANGDRALLHAWKVSFEQPFTGKPIQVCAPPPDDFPPLPSAFRKEELFCRKEGPPVTEKGMENH